MTQFDVFVLIISLLCLPPINFIGINNIWIFISSHVLIILQEEPYLMTRTPEKGELLTGNDRYAGFCKDLADKISDRLGIQCKYDRMTLVIK